MAAAKKAASGKAPTTPASAPPVERPIKYDPVMVALSKASAARLLLVNAGDFFENEEDLDWIEAFADEALGEALAEASTAYVKAVGAKPAPAAEAGR
jgi:hypothetical protein